MAKLNAQTITSRPIIVKAISAVDVRTSNDTANVGGTDWPGHFPSRNADTGNDDRKAQGENRQ